MSLEYREHYWDDPRSRAEFLRFTREMHSLDLTRWGEHGFWDDAFQPYSFFDGDRMVANVCVYRLPMVVHGKRQVVPQVSTVATDPAYRLRGLSRELTDRALACGRDGTAGFTFLFANVDAFGFYSKCAFTRVRQHRFLYRGPVESGGGTATPLDLTGKKHLSLLHEIGRNRESVSDEIGCLSAKLLMFHALYTVGGCGYWLPEPEVVVFASVSGTKLQVFDVVGRRTPPLVEWSKHLPMRGINEVEFLFTPDKMNLAGPVAVPCDDPDGTHVKGTGFPRAGVPFRFPYTAHA